jgi:glycosyltransferase involved in cell wall biosynthesis
VLSVSLQNPLVSVVMPVYNADEYLAEAIESILNQTFEDFEFIILCDDPSEKTRTIIENFQGSDSRIRVVYQERKGLISALNEGFSLATGTYIGRMDADDICYPERLEKQVAFMAAHPECALVAAQVEWINESGNIIGHWKADLQADTSNKIRKILPAKNCLAHPTILLRRSVTDMYRYDSHQKNIEDYDLWLRMASDNLVLCKLPAILLQLRIHQSSIVSTREKVSPGSDIIRCKARYLTTQLHMGRISIFNLKVLCYLVLECGIWPIRYIKSKIMKIPS